MAKLQDESEVSKGFAGLKGRAVLVAPLLMHLIDLADRLAEEIPFGVQAKIATHEDCDRRLTRYD